MEIILGNKARSGKNSKDLRLLQKLSLFFFSKSKTTAIIWILITVFGFVSYTTLLKREGFPAVETPFALANGTYLVDSPEQVDKEVVAPLNSFLLEQEGVKSVLSGAQSNFYTVAINFEEGVNAEDKSTEYNQQIEQSNLLPKNATVQISAFQFGFTDRGDDLLISLYTEDNSATTEELEIKAQKYVEYIQSKNIEQIENISVINPFEEAFNQKTGQPELTQKKFDRFGERQNNQSEFYNSVIIGITAKDGSDNLKLDESVQKVINEGKSTEDFKDFEAAISASYAPEIDAQISELQKVLIEALVAILFVCSLIIAVRASLVVVLALFTVLAATIGMLFITGYTLNTITLFALILSLALIIDDTIIMVESLEAKRRKYKLADKVVEVATGKVSKAMTAATLTAALSFAPLLFVTGILGEFIRAIPITIISALFISLTVALVFIPLFSKYLLLNKKQLGKDAPRSFSSGAEHLAAEIIAKPMLAVKNSKPKLAAVSITAILFSFAFIGAGGYLFQKVTFNIFPAAKDANQVLITLNFPANTNLQESQEIVDEVDQVIGNEIGVNFEHASYYGQATNFAAALTINISDYKDRDIKSPEIVENLESIFSDYGKAQVTAAQLDAGPPVSAFAVRIDSSTNRNEGLELSKDIAKYLDDIKLERIDGSVAEIKSTNAANADIYSREDDKQYVEVTAEFVDNDTTTLVGLAQEAVEEEFDDERLSAYGITSQDISFDFGQEDENQDSFKALAIAFPLVLLVIYLVLAIEFRSLIQPLLIFMAIPFSLFGITIGLYITDNAFSFFAMLGFFALIGLSLKNTILLTDFANQSRAAGNSAVDAAHEALAERFRPLIATSLTAVVSLIPLALTSPFWEGLTVVLIFGLLSSTFLVVTVFPYYYLAGEFARSLGRKGYAKLRGRS